MPYLRLLQGRAGPSGVPAENGEDGPLLGPFDVVRTVGGREIRLSDADGYRLSIVDGRVYYAGTFYAEWSVFSGSINPLVQGPLTAFDPQQAIPPAEDEPCECEQPGHFCSGVPGVLAHLENGRVVPDCEIERCDACGRYDSDEDAEAVLREAGLFAAGDPRSSQPGERRQTYTVHLYATVRVKLAGIVADDSRDAARQANEQFDWGRQLSQAEFTDEITAFVVDVDGDEDFRQTRRFGGDLSEVDSAAAGERAWLLVIHQEALERIEVCSSRESAFQHLYEYVEERWETTFGEEPIDRDPKRAVERYFDAGPVSYTLEDRALL